MSLIVAPIYCYGVWLTMSYFFSEFHDVAAPRLLDVASFEYAHTVNDVGDGLRCFFKGECVLAFSSLFPSRFLAMGGELLATLPFGLPVFILNALGSAGMRLPSQACHTLHADSQLPFRGSLAALDTRRRSSDAPPRATAQ
jgi:hypothetical protein